MIANAVSSLVTDGRAAGCRAIDLRVEGGITLRLLPDRGLDAGDAWFAGVPLDWRSPVGETAAVAGDWMQSFGGGLMVTCGLRNVGVPSEGHGQHGDFTFQTAAVEAVERAGDALIVRGRVAEVGGLRSGGILADVTPTLLELMGQDQPEEMTGESLIDHAARI